MMSDGTTKAIVYNEDVHYMDDEGLWQDIDNTLYTSDSIKSNGDAFLDSFSYQTKKSIRHSNYKLCFEYVFLCST